MSQAAVCVVVPVYKAAATLDRCVQSVLSQQVPGGLQCVLVNDGSPDNSGALCDAWAAKDPRVRVLHQEDLGVSAARNNGMALADSEFLVFLDSDDALRPNALQAALAAQRADPDAFVVWNYTTDAADPAPVTQDGAALPPAALARLWLDCYLPMPWNKLYRTALAQTLQFNKAFTLGEDLQFVLDYVALLQTRQPQWHFRQLTAPLTFYDCSCGGSLSHRYHTDYCPVWVQHFSKLNAMAEALHAPAEDLLPLHRAELRVYAEGAADILHRDPAAPAVRRRKMAEVLREPWLRGLLRTLKAEKSYSPYYLPCLWRSRLLLNALYCSKFHGKSWLFGKLDWAGYYLFLGRRQR